MKIQQTNLIEELGINTWPEEERDVIFEKISQTIFEGILIKSLAILTDEDARELNELVDRGETFESIVIFLSGKIPELDKITQHEITSFKTNSRDFIEYITN